MHKLTRFGGGVGRAFRFSLSVLLLAATLANAKAAALVAVIPPASGAAG